MNKFKILKIIFITFLACAWCASLLYINKFDNTTIGVVSIDNLIVKNDDNRHFVIPSNFSNIHKNDFLETTSHNKEYKYLYDISKNIYFILFSGHNLIQDYFFDGAFTKETSLKKHITVKTYLKLVYNLDKREVNFILPTDNFIVGKKEKINNNIVYSLKNIGYDSILKINGNEIALIDYDNDFLIAINDLTDSLIEIYDRNANELLNSKNTSLEDGLWQNKVGDCSSSKPGSAEISMKQSNDASDGNNSLKITSKNHYACTNKTFPVQMKEDKLYQLSFDYKNITGKDIRYYYKLRSEENNKILGYASSKTIQAKDNKWHTFSTVINPKTVKENFVHPEYIEEEDGFDADLSLKEGVNDFYSGNPIEDIKFIDIFFYAPSDGNKEIINLYDNVQLKEYELAETKEIKLESIIDTGIILTENIFLQQGENKFEYIVDDKNLLDTETASFENGLWQKEADDCSNSKPGEPEIDLKESNDASDGKIAIELSSKNHYACISKAFSVNLSDGKLYKLQFDYKNIKGEKAMYYYNLQSGEKQNTHSEIIKTEDNNWHTYETIIDPKINEVRHFSIHFYAPSNGNEEIINLYDNVRLTEYLPKDIDSYYLYAEQEIDESPKLNSVEYKAVNKWKNKVVLHGVKDSFLLAYPKKYNAKWKAYPTRTRTPKVESHKVEKLLRNYKVPETESNRQATKNEINEFVNNKLISAIGKKFISKNFDGSIHNDNLNNRWFGETFFKSSIPEDTHYQINNYGNSWWIDVDKICKEDSSCMQNDDGTYDIALVIEHKFNRCANLVLWISSFVLIGLLGYLGSDFGRKRKTKNKSGSTKIGTSRKKKGLSYIDRL